MLKIITKTKCFQYRRIHLQGEIGYKKKKGMPQKKEILV